MICHGCNKEGPYISECYKTPDADKESILKIKTQEWNDKKRQEWQQLKLKPKVRTTNDTGVGFIVGGTPSKEKKGGKDVICHRCNKKATIFLNLVGHD